MPTVCRSERKRETVSLKQAAKVFKFSPIDQLFYSDKNIEEKIKLRCAKKLKKDEYYKQNNWTLHLFGKEVGERRVPPVEIQHVDSLVGCGVFSTDDIAPLTYIGNYLGLVRKRKRLKDRDNNYVFRYVIGPHDTPWVIDALDYGNFTRFINHSYEPNLTSKWLIHQGIAHVIFFSNRRISSGSQLTYDYGPYYWRSRSYPLSL